MFKKKKKEKEKEKVKQQHTRQLVIKHINNAFK